MGVPMSFALTLVRLEGALLKPGLQCVGWSTKPC